MCINMTIEQLKSLLSFSKHIEKMNLKIHFISAKEIISEIDVEMNVEPKFFEERRKNHWMKILKMKFWNHLKSHLELIIFFIYCR